MLFLKKYSIQKKYVALYNHNRSLLFDHIMKKYTNYFVIAFTILSLFACKKNDSPSAVAEKFQNHLNRLEFDEAKKYATKFTGTQIDILFSEMIGNQKLTNEPKKVKAKSEKIMGDKAYCIFDNAGIMDTIKLTKINGEWKVFMGGDYLSAPKDTTLTTEKKTEEIKK